MLLHAARHCQHNSAEHVLNTGGLQVAKLSAACVCMCAWPVLTVACLLNLVSGMPQVLLSLVPSTVLT